MPLTIQLFSAGYCIQSKKLVIRGAKHEPVKFYTIFALIRHPKDGYVLFDTGYSSRFFEETKSFPFSIYSRITPVYFKEEDSAVVQLQKRGISPTEIKTIILSHFHPDHVGAIKDFPQAQFICLRSAYQDVKNRKGFSALVRAFLPGMLPKNFEQRVRFAEDGMKIQLDGAYAPFDIGYDLLGDASILAIELPGHAKGQIGVILNTQGGMYFLIADACWLSESYRRNILPHPVAGLLFSSRQDYQTTLEKIHQMYKKNPEIKIIPSHCPEVWEQFTQKDV